MSDQHPSARELHDRHADERIRVGQFARHEVAVRESERARIIGQIGVPMRPEPADPDVFFEGCMI